MAIMDIARIHFTTQENYDKVESYQFIQVVEKYRIKIPLIDFSLTRQINYFIEFCCIIFTSCRKLGIYL